MNKQVTLSLELAREMYNSNNEQLKKVALENYTESELKNEKKFEEMFLDMWFGCTLHRDVEYPHSVFLMKDGKVMFEQDFKNNRLYCSYQNVWKVLKDRFVYNYDQIRDLIEWIVEERFKLMGLTSDYIIMIFIGKWKNISN